MQNLPRVLYACKNVYVYLYVYIFQCLNYFVFMQAQNEKKAALKIMKKFI